MKKIPLILILSFTAFLVAVNIWAGPLDVARQLAYKLVQEGDHRAAAIEYRRLALGVEDPMQRAGYYWAAAHEYFQAGNVTVSMKMLDNAEDAGPQLTASALLLRVENSLADSALDEAGFYLEAAASNNPDKESKAFIARRLAGIAVKQNRLSEATQQLQQCPIDSSSALAAVKHYKTHRDKSPRLGGILGMIPGLGHAYSGEYATALRSLILNGLFIYGMIDTAGDDEWGAFTVITFFELTWYTGSIYGGIDAAHRYNRNRLNNCVDAIDGGSGFFPDLKQIPIVSLKFQF